jgi:alpha-beta hydrolase superfamily lysophospholipase
MVLPGEAPPGGLHLRRRRAWFDPEDDVRISSDHGLSVSPDLGGQGWRQSAAAGCGEEATRLTAWPLVPSPCRVPSIRRVALVTAIAAAPVAFAYRFALLYRGRAGFPRRNPPINTPADLGMPYEELTVAAPGTTGLPAWFVPARGGAPGPGVALIHGWESARDRTLPMIHFLTAAGFHCLTIDVRGHGQNAAETLPVSAGEFGADALAAFEALMARPEVTVGAISGHSMGAIGAILAAAADDRIAAVVATSAPADPYRLTRQTFRLARLPIPDPIAYPLAWLTTRVYLRPRGHRAATISASTALTTHDRPMLLIHGDADDVVPVGHLERLLRRASKSGRRVESLVIPGGRHSWLYEFEAYRRAVAGFLAEALGGPYSPAEAADRAAAVPAARIPAAEAQFDAVNYEPGGIRSLADLAIPRRRGSSTGASAAAPTDGASESPKPDLTSEAAS